MRNQPLETTIAVANAPADGIATRIAVWIETLNRTTGMIEEIGCWDGDEDTHLSVIRGRDGVTVSRPYYGNAPLKIGDIVRSSGLSVETTPIDVSQLADAVRLVLRTHDAARAPIEIHEILLSPETGRPLPAELPIYHGIIDTAPIKTPRVGGIAKATLNCVSEMMALLSRGNPEKGSYEAQKLRGDDEWKLYAGSVETWDVPWGQ